MSGTVWNIKRTIRRYFNHAGTLAPSVVQIKRGGGEITSFVTKKEISTGRGIPIFVHQTNQFRFGHRVRRYS